MYFSNSNDDKNILLLRIAKNNLEPRLSTHNTEKPWKMDSLNLVSRLLLFIKDWKILEFGSPDSRIFSNNILTLDQEKKSKSQICIELRRKAYEEQTTNDSKTEICNGCNEKLTQKLMKIKCLILII